MQISKKIGTQQGGRNQQVHIPLPAAPVGQQPSATHHNLFQPLGVGGSTGGLQSESTSGFLASSNPHYVSARSQKIIGTRLWWKN